MHKDSEYFDRFTIATVLNCVDGEGRRFTRTEDLVVTRETFDKQVASAIQGMPKKAEDPLCLLTFGTQPTETFTSREHLVPEGLGFPWAVLPPGVGTCDRMNKALGRAELEWLRFGRMGTFRPFFVGRGKDSPPEYHAPLKSQPHVSFGRSPEGRRRIEIHSDADLGLPDALGGQSEITIRTTATDANSACVSQAVHKLAYLALWLSRPDAIFDPSFDPVREFLVEPREENHRLAIETMIPGSAPGLAIHFTLELYEVAAERTEQRQSFRIASVLAGIHIHHMAYGVALVGELPTESLEIDWAVRRWEPVNAQPVRRPVEITFNSGRIRKLEK